MSLPPSQAPERALPSVLPAPPQLPHRPTGTHPLPARLRHVSALTCDGARAVALAALRFPWGRALSLLHRRFREDQLALTAGSLTFTTILALVPFFIVVLAVFTAFPVFGKLQDQLQRWLVASLIPEAIARQVLGYMTQFASKASRLGAAGFTALFLTAVALIFTIDRTLNRIWRVRRPRALAQRLLIYWAAISVGPLLLALSLATTASVVSFSRELVGTLPGLRLLLNGFEFLLLAAGIAGLYHFGPNARVRWPHAWAGALLATACLELAKKAVGLYIGSVPTYSVLYGAFASMPILLLWIYLAWNIVLLGAVLVAQLPALLAGALRPGGGPGWHFQLALELLSHLHASQAAGLHGRSAAEVARTLQVDLLQLEPVVEALIALDWVGELREARDGQAGRLVLLADPEATPMAPLAERLLLAPSELGRAFLGRAGMARMRLADLL